MARILLLMTMMKQSGFTLIELMIVVAIIGILAMIALPQFLRFSSASKRAEARVLLSAVRTAQNAYYGSHDHFAYANNVDVLNNHLGLGAITQGKFYAFFYQTINAAGHTANPLATQDYLALVTADIDGDGDAIRDGFVVKNNYPGLFPSIGDDQLEHYYDDLTKQYLITP